MTMTNRERKCSEEKRRGRVEESHLQHYTVKWEIKIFWRMLEAKVGNWGTPS